uniref:Uncharacterized protein n=1 Tax=Globodera rostochiensis TaxID=31243 RepID=A0A914IEV9_GLORO
MSSNAQLNEKFDGPWMSKLKNADVKPTKMLDDLKQSKAVKRSQGMDDDDEIICIGTKVANMKQEADLEPKLADEQPNGPPSYKQKVIHSDLWKVFKGKYMLGIYLCQNCWNKIYVNKEKLLILETGRVMLTFDMCEECAYMNCRAADFMAPPKPKNDDLRRVSSTGVQSVQTLTYNKSGTGSTWNGAWPYDFVLRS